MATDPFVVSKALPAMEATSSSPLRARESEWARLLGERDEARAQVRALVQANRRMEEFLGIASHELRIPVTSSYLGVQLAARRMDLLLGQVVLQDHDARLASQLATVYDLLTRAEIRLEQLTRMVNDLLDISRLHASQLALHPAYADLRAIVRAAIDEQRQLAPTRRIRLHLSARKAMVWTVWADADRIHQVVSNYLTNALKYTVDDRPVDVRVQGRAGWARVSVRDQGPGVPTEEEERIWEPFHRASGVEVASETLHGAADSLGLGLHICKTIIEQHHGQVGVRSTPGQGSTFWFTLLLASTNC